MGGTGPLPARLNGHVGARGAWSSRSVALRAREPGEEDVVGTSSGACPWGTGRWSAAHSDGFLDRVD